MLAVSTSAYHSVRNVNLKNKVMKWFLKVLRQYADFEGRAGRREYWTFVLFNIIFAFAVIILSSMIYAMYGRTPNVIYYYYLYIFAMFLPNLAVMVRRLHDTGRSGWFFFVNLIPFIGSFWLLIILATDGLPGENRYGNNPKETEGQLPFDRLKSLAVALIVASAFWIVTSALEHTLVYRLFNDVHFQSIIYMSSFLLIPVGLIVAGYFILQEKMIGKNAAYAFIAAGGLWILLRLIHSLNIFQNGLFMLCYILIGLGLLVLGTSVLQQKENTKAVVLLLGIGSILWVLQLLRTGWTFPIRLNDINGIIQLVSSTTSIITTSTLLYLAATLRVMQHSSTTQEGIEPINNPSVKSSPVKPQTKGITEQTSSQVSGERMYNERDNKGMRVNTFEQSMSYWMVERMQNTRKDPFVYYVFKNSNDPHKAMLDLPFIHQAADTGKLVCDELFRFGYFPVSNNGVFTGEYDAFIAGADLTYDQWENIHATFTRYNGTKKNDLEPDKTAKGVSTAGNGNAANVSFVREDSDGTSVWRVFRASGKADAMAFLSQQQVTRPLYYIIVETPDGNFGRDKDGFYQE